MLRDQIAADTFTEIARRSKPDLRRGLTAGIGSELGRQVAADGGDRDQSRLDADRPTDIMRRHTKRRNNMTQNRSDRLNKLFPIAFVVTAALWLVVILITDFPAWTLAVYVALGIPAVKYFSRSDKNDQSN